MRTTIDIPVYLMKKAKMKAVSEGITMKELFTKILEKEVSGETPGLEPAPWEKLHGKGSASKLTPEESAFEDYSGPDWITGIQVNDPDN